MIMVVVTVAVVVVVVVTVAVAHIANQSSAAYDPSRMMWNYYYYQY